MEPFVPTPDERISHKDAASGKGRQGNGNQPPTPPGESGGWRRHLPLLAVTLVFVLLLAMSHSVNRGKIRSEERRVGKEWTRRGKRYKQTTMKGGRVTIHE